MCVCVCMCVCVFLVRFVPPKDYARWRLRLVFACRPTWWDDWIWIVCAYNSSGSWSRPWFEIRHTPRLMVFQREKKRATLPKQTPHSWFLPPKDPNRLIHISSTIIAHDILLGYVITWQCRQSSEWQACTKKLILLIMVLQKWIYSFDSWYVRRQWTYLQSKPILVAKTVPLDQICLWNVG